MGFGIWRLGLATKHQRSPRVGRVVNGVGFGVKGLEGLGFGVENLELRVQGLRFTREHQGSMLDG